MNDQLLDYLLDRLDAPAKRQVEARLQVDEAARRQVELLRRALAPLAADQEIEPPSSLAARTIARVAEHACRRLPTAPTPTRFESGGRPWWRRADMLIAASLLVVCTGIGLPLLARMRSAAVIVECQDNLRRFHVALKNYEDKRQRLPALDLQSSRDVAGMIIPMLQEAGVLGADFSVRCPGHGPFQACSFTVDQIRAMTPEQFASHAPNLLASYAFTLGYRDDQGLWHPLNRGEDAGDNNVLILADSPGADAAGGNSRHHGGRGQNVLFLDGHVQFLPQRTFAGDDIYLNTNRCVAAGNDCRDFVLGSSASKP